jgi:biopolymer transport protein ExbD
MLVFMSSKTTKIITALIAILILIGTSLAVFFYLDKNEPSTEQQPTAEDTQKIFDNISADTAQYFAEENVKLEELAKQISTVEDYRTLESPRKTEVGISAAQQARASGNLELANQILDLIMQEDNALAISAGQLCYLYAVSNERKDFCVQQLTTAARSQGIIGPNESLPKSYYDQTGEVEQG